VRAVILGVQTHDVSDAEFASSLEEIARLGKTLGLAIVGRVTQKRARLAPGVVVGEGKLRELARWTGGSGKVHVGPPQKKRGSREEPTEEAGAQSDDGAPLAPRERAGVVLVDHDLTPSQARNLEHATGAEVIDRSGVILAIFQRHARSREARLQVEIARLQYVAPRLREAALGADRQGGGIGGKGAGESSAELDRRKIRDRIAELRHELAAIERDSATRRKQRASLEKVALVGYTNAGKSSWMRALTGSDVLVRDELFATLDTTVRALQPESSPRILVSDTVGFIKRLPHDLVASFRSTLDEARECNLLVHVVDAADPAFPAQIQVTREVLHEIGADQSPTLLVLNKSDRLTPEQRESLRSEYPQALLLSVRDPRDVATLRDQIRAHFERNMQDADLVIPYSLSKLVAEAHKTTHVLREQHEEDGTHLRVRANAEQLAKLKAALAQ
jgi:GTP-binding protein HflX